MAKAYAFEPKRKESKNDKQYEVNTSNEFREDVSRLNSRIWCNCDRCSIMPAAVECLCCRELEAVRGKLDGGSSQCITEHTHFAAHCLNRELLQSVLVLLHDQQCSLLALPVSNRFRNFVSMSLMFWCWFRDLKLLCIDGANSESEYFWKLFHICMNLFVQIFFFRAYRLCAYRLFTSWIHGRLGAHRRCVIPACVVNVIRATFPDDNAVYTGFLESDRANAWPW